MKKIYAMIAALLLVASLTACGQPDPVASPVSTADPVISDADLTEPAELVNGSRFEGEIMLEGMPETVKYEHVLHEGEYAIDFDYELFSHAYDGEYDVFSWLNNTQGAQQTYMSVFTADYPAADTLGALQNTMSRAFTSIENTTADLPAGQASMLIGSIPAEGTYTADTYMLNYIIPSGERCVVVEMMYTAEMAEGVGSRMTAMLQTLEIL